MKHVLRCELLFSFLFKMALDPEGYVLNVMKVTECSMIKTYVVYCLRSISLATRVVNIAVIKTLGLLMLGCGE